MDKVCPKCGAVKNSQGFNLHLKFCKGKEPEAVGVKKAVEKLEYPGVTNTFGMFNASQIRAKDPEIPAIPEEKIAKNDVCNCKGYEGQSYTCPEHKAKVECPFCHCIDVEQKQGFMDPIQLFRCGMCGVAYERQLYTGAYLFNK